VPTGRGGTAADGHRRDWRQALSCYWTLIVTPVAYSLLDDVQQSDCSRSSGGAIEAS